MFFGSVLHFVAVSGILFLSLVSSHIHCCCKGAISTLHYSFFFFFFKAREALPTWDKQIQSLCFQVNNLLEKISQTAPEWTAQAMEAQMAQWLPADLLCTRHLFPCCAEWFHSLSKAFASWPYIFQSLLCWILFKEDIIRAGSTSI